MITQLKLKELQYQFRQKLSDLYDKREIEALFIWTIEEVDQLGLKDVVLDKSTTQLDRYKHILQELAKGKPIQYIFRKAYFNEMAFYVDESVLIPRPETEELLAVLIKKIPMNSSVCDIGTGSGCIAIALKNYRKDLNVYACDISQMALDVAKKNALKNDIDVTFSRCDILNESPGTFDVLVSNPPYIAREEEAEMHINVVEHEPHMALFVDDTDVLIFYKRIIELGIESSSMVFFEISEIRKTELAQFLKHKKLKHQFNHDINDKPRILEVNTNEAI